MKIRTYSDGEIEKIVESSNPIRIFFFLFAKVILWLVSYVCFSIIKIFYWLLSPLCEFTINSKNNKDEVVQ